MRKRTIEEDDAQRIARAFHEGRDPFGLGDRFETVTDEHVLLHAEDMLAGRVRVPADAVRADLDRVARTLLAHEGCDPDAVAVLAAFAMGLGIRDGDDERVAVIEVGKGGACVRRLEVHSGPVSWHQDHTLEIHETLPDTVQIAAAGMPLARLVSHPALDPLALTIGRIDGRLIRIAS